MPYVKEVLETKVRPENAGTDIAHLGVWDFFCIVAKVLNSSL